MRSTPSQAQPTPRPMGHTLCVRGQEAQAEYNQTVEKGATLLYMLLHNILYSVQRSKTSEDHGEGKNQSSDFEMSNDP